MGHFYRSAAPGLITGNILQFETAGRHRAVVVDEGADRVFQPNLARRDAYWKCRHQVGQTVANNSEAVVGEVGVIADYLDIHRLSVSGADFALLKLDRFENLDNFHARRRGDVDHADATGATGYEGIGFAVRRVGPE